MNDFFEKIKTTLTASVNTSIEAKLGRFERGLLIAGRLSFWTLIAGLGFFTFRQSPIALIVTSVALFCFVAVIVFWIVQHFIFKSEGTPTIYIGSDGTVFVGQLNDPVKNIKDVRQICQGRQDPPAADGEVLNGDIKDPNNVRPYSPDEKTREEALLRQKLEEFEDDLFEKVIGQIRNATNLPAPSSPIGIQTSPNTTPNAPNNSKTA